MSETHTWTSGEGLRLASPPPGDIVTVRVKRRPKHGEQEGHHPLALLVGLGRGDEADNPQHYRMNNIWRVLAVNGGQAVVQGMREGYNKDRKEIWSIAHHEWFEASALFEALSPTPARGERE